MTPSREPERALTLEEWREWAATAKRNRTDDYIGAHTAARRHEDAENSRVVTGYPGYVPGRPQDPIEPKGSCGTHSGYNLHLRHSEPACDACLTAHRLYVRERAAIRRHRGAA